MRILISYFLTKNKESSYIFFAITFNYVENKKKYFERQIGNDVLDFFKKNYKDVE